MKRYAASTVLALVLALAAPAFAASDSNIVTIEALNPVNVKASPGKSTNIIIGFLGGPLQGNYQIYLDVIDKNGNFQYVNGFYPTTVTNQWSGSYNQSVWLPVPSSLANGVYSIVAGLYDPNSSIIPTLIPGAGVSVTPIQYDPAYNFNIIGKLYVGVIPPAPIATALSSPDTSNYRLVFNQDFTAMTSLSQLGVSASGPVGANGINWYYAKPDGEGVGDASFYVTNNAYAPFNVGNGYLTIRMNHNADGTFVSGNLSSVDPQGRGFTQKYGYFEMSAQFPSGQGVAPAFWLLSASSLADRSLNTAEIDIVEAHPGNAADGMDPNAVLMRAHDWQPNGVDASRSGLEFDDEAGITTGFHRYGVDVEPDYLTFYFDGHITSRIQSYPDVRQPLMVLVTLSAGIGWPDSAMPSPQDMLVKYVRVWASPNSPNY